MPAAAWRSAILVADDEPMVRDVISAALVLDGYELVLASDGRDALDRCGRRTTPIDLALIDMIMPGMSGIELMNCLRDLFPKLRIVFMSGYPHQEAFEKAGLAPSDGRFLMKPFTARAVRAKVAEELAAMRKTMPG